MNLISQVASRAQNDANKACWQISGYTQRYIDEQIMSGTKIVSDKPFSITTSAKTEMTNKCVKELRHDLPHREQYFDKDWNMTLTVDCKSTEYLLEGEKASSTPEIPQMKNMKARTRPVAASKTLRTYLCSQREGHS